MTGIRPRTGFLRSRDQTALFFRHYRAKNKKASVLIAHGFGEHGGRYPHVADRLLEEDYDTWCIDFRGHGFSDGRRGDVEDFRRFEDDLMVAIEAAREHLYGHKLFLLGHSMGALISLRLLSRSAIQIGGIILSSPLLALRMSLPSFKEWISEPAARLAPLLRVSTGIRGSHLSSNPVVAAAYDADPLVVKKLPLRTVREIFRSFKEAFAMAQGISSPLFMQVADADPVVCPKASKKWFSLINSSMVDATLKSYPGFLHEIYNERHGQEAIDDFIDWLNRRA